LFGYSYQFVAGIISDHLDTNANVGHHVLRCFGRLAIILLQETSCCCWSEATHLHLTDHKATSVEVVNNLAAVHIGVWFDQKE